MSSNQPRKPAGTPAGGRWAPATHAEAQVDLYPTMSEFPDNYQRVGGVSGAPVAVLRHLVPATEQGWKVLFRLAEVNHENWCLLGGQMMYLLAIEAGRSLPRPTSDMDVVVDLRAHKGSTEWLAKWLVSHGFEAPR